MPEYKNLEKTPKKAKPGGNSLCSLCFHPVHDNQPYLWSKKRDGSYAFVHVKCLRGE